MPFLVCDYDFSKMSCKTFISLFFCKILSLLQNACMVLRRASTPLLFNVFWNKVNFQFLAFHFQSLKFFQGVFFISKGSFAWAENVLFCGYLTLLTQAIYFLRSPKLDTYSKSLALVRLESKVDVLVGKHSVVGTSSIDAY